MLRPSRREALLEIVQPLRTPRSHRTWGQDGSSEEEPGEPAEPLELSLGQPARVALVELQIAANHLYTAYLHGDAVAFISELTDAMLAYATLMRSVPFLQPARVSVERLAELLSTVSPGETLRRALAGTQLLRLRVERLLRDSRVRAPGGSVLAGLGMTLAGLADYAFDSGSEGRDHVRRLRLAVRPFQDLEEMVQPLRTPLSHRTWGQGDPDEGFGPASDSSAERERPLRMSAIHRAISILQHAANHLRTAFVQGDVDAYREELRQAFEAFIELIPYQGADSGPPGNPYRNEWARVLREATTLSAMLDDAVLTIPRQPQQATLLSLRVDSVLSAARSLRPDPEVFSREALQFYTGSALVGVGDYLAAVVSSLVSPDSEAYRVAFALRRELGRVTLR